MRVIPALVTSRFYRQVIGLDSVRQQLALLDRPALADALSAAPAFGRAVHQQLQSFTTYDMLLFAVADSFKIPIASPVLPRVLLVMRLLRIWSSSILLLCKERHADRRDLEEVCTRLLAVTNTHMTDDLRADPSLDAHWTRSIEAITNLRNMLRSRLAAQERWTTDHWHACSADDHLTTVFWFGSYHLLSRVTGTAPQDWHETFRLHFASLNRAVEELVMWKRNVLERTSSLIYSGVRCQFTGRVSLTEIARYVYTGPEGALLLETITTELLWLRDHEPSELGKEARRMLHGYYEDADGAARIFAEHDRYVRASAVSRGGGECHS